MNVMKWTFYRNGEENPPGLTKARVDQKFNLLQPVYTISDNYSMNASKSTKTWVGLQVEHLLQLQFLQKRIRVFSAQGVSVMHTCHFDYEKQQ